jgi:glutamyl-tRNA reductase
MTTDAVEEMDRILGSGAPLLHEQPGCQHAEDVAAAIYEDAERIKRGEIEEALGELDARGELSDAQRDIVEGMADAIVEQLLPAPIPRVRRGGDGCTLDAVVRLFDLDIEVEADDDEMSECGSYRPEAMSVDN